MSEEMHTMMSEGAQMMPTGGEMGGMAGWWWLIPLLGFVLIVALVIMVIVVVMRQTANNPPPQRPEGRRSAREILDERYALGEIDEEEYRKRKSHLED